MAKAKAHVYGTSTRRKSSIEYRLEKSQVEIKELLKSFMRKLDNPSGTLVNLSDCQKDDRDLSESDNEEESSSGQPLTCLKIKVKLILDLT